MKSPKVQSFQLPWINEFLSLRNGQRLLGVFVSGKQGVKGTKHYFSFTGSSNQNGQTSQRKASDDDRGSLQN